MPSEKSPALVLRLTEFSETSLIATLYTREFGKITALAKGARRPKSPFEAALDLLAHCRIVFLHKSSDVLDLLTEARLERRFRSATRSLPRLYAAFYVAELLNLLTDRGDPCPELFDVASRTIQGLDGRAAVEASVVHFEFAALRLLGHVPALDACAACGRASQGASRVAFGLLAGGILCPACRVGQRQVVSVTRPTLNLLRRWRDGDVGSREPGRADADETGGPAGGTDDRPTERSPEIEPAPGELRAVMNRYMNHLLGHEPRLQRYLS